MSARRCRQEAVAGRIETRASSCARAVRTLGHFEVALTDVSPSRRAGRDLWTPSRLLTCCLAGEVRTAGSPQVRARPRTRGHLRGWARAIRGRSPARWEAGTYVRIRPTERGGAVGLAAEDPGGHTGAARATAYPVGRDPAYQDDFGAAPGRAASAADLVSAPTPSRLAGIEVLGMLEDRRRRRGLARIVAPISAPIARRGVSFHLVSGRAGRRDRDRPGRIGGDVPGCTNRSRPVRTALGCKSCGPWSGWGGVAVRLAREEIRRAPTDGAVIGCLTLGRAGQRDDEPLLEAIVADQGREKSVRLAALFGLTVGRRAAPTKILARMVESGDPELAGAARGALALSGARNDEARHKQGSSLAVDEALAIAGGHIDSETLLQFLMAGVDAGGGRPTDGEHIGSPGILHGPCLDLPQYPAKNALPMFAALKATEARKRWQ